MANARRASIGQEIRDAQQEWAASHGVPCDSRGYVSAVEDNLWQPLSARARGGYEGGDGQELQGHMKALHSSSALVVNFFDYWTDRDKGPLLSALGVDADGPAELGFEAKFRTERKGVPPNLDLAIELSSHPTIAIESKFTEWTSQKRKVDTSFRAKYLRRVPDLWTRQGLPRCQELAEEMGAVADGGKPLFQFLDAAQLLKHALGLATQLGGGGFSLYYLYYDWRGEAAEAHKREIERFASSVGEEIRFKALTYQDLYTRLRTSAQAEPDYLDYLRDRYFPEAGGLTP